MLNHAAALRVQMERRARICWLTSAATARLDGPAARVK